VNDANELGRIRAKYGLPAEKPYVFGFGAADPRKNTLRILLAWKELSAELQNKFMLLLTGIQEQALGEFRRKVQELGLTQSVILYGFADEQDLPALLREAKVFCYPSLSEGFGLPILEAFACETAVLSGDMTSLPEVAGDAALLINPKEVSEIKNGLMKLLENDIYRADLVRRGRERLHVFTWKNGAARVAKVFEDVLNGRA
jgi:glycosyltransferase involved in cell wall biosynthesis